MRRGMLSRSNGTSQGGRVSTVEAARFLWERRRFFGPQFVALGLLAMIAYGMGAWGAEGIRRNPYLHLRPGDAAIIMGAGALVSSSVGMMLFGSLADWLTARGFKDAAIRACAIAGLMTTILGIATQLATNVWMLFSGFVLLNLSLTAYAALGPLAINMVTPNEIRGQGIALYLLVLNVIGLGVGPTIIPIISDHVLHDPSMLRYSIAIVCGVCGITALCVLYAIRPVYIRLIDEAGTWSAKTPVHR
jgi:MFS family permease